MTQTVTSKIRTLQRHCLDWVVRHHPNLGLEDRAEYFTKLFEPYLEPHSRVLDVGGGWGFYKKPLEDRGHHVTVLDVVKPGYQKAPVVIYDGCSGIPFPDKSFDASMFITVLHHIPDPEKVIRDAIRVTRKRLILVEDIYRKPAGYWWTKLRDQIYNFEFFGHPGQFKTKDSWIRMLDKLGCERIHEKEVYTWLSGMRILNGVFIFDIRDNGNAGG